MTADHSSYEALARDRRHREEYRQGYAEARRAFLIGQAVRERRLALGLSQVELATRAGMTQPALSRLEAGGVVPTIPLLERISLALDADLIVEIAPTPPEPSPDHASWGHPSLADMQVIARLQDRGALRLDHLHDQALCEPEGRGDLLITHIMPM